jgi:type IV secretory pathway TraG/TraD family ATPase VirD4
MSEGRLDPPLALFLDEAAQIAPIPSLPKVMSDGGGSGITTVVVLQSLSQARERWGRQAADAMWNAATTKLIFGGIAEDEDLESISRLCGEIDTESRSVSRGRGFDSETIAPQRRRLLESAAIRGLSEGTVLLLYRRFPPILAHLAPWWQRRIAPLIRQRAP